MCRSKTAANWTPQSCTYVSSSVIDSVLVVVKFKTSVFVVKIKSVVLEPLISTGI